MLFPQYLGPVANSGLLILGCLSPDFAPHSPLNFDKLLLSGPQFPQLHDKVARMNDQFSGPFSQRAGLKTSPSKMKGGLSVREHGQAQDDCCQ